MHLQATNICCWKRRYQPWLANLLLVMSAPAGVNLVETYRMDYAISTPAFRTACTPETLPKVPKREWDITGNRSGLAL
jgi:hypothetical protein